MCYPGTGAPPRCADSREVAGDDRGVADQMIERRKEKLTLDAITDLVRYSRGVREERKAVLLVTEGWRLFGPDQSLARKLGCGVPQLQWASIANGPPDSQSPRPNACGFLPDRVREGSTGFGVHRRRPRLSCDARRSQRRKHVVLSHHLRGLAVFDEPISKPTTGRPPPGATTLTPPAIDQARLAGRLESLRTLAGATDGLALINSNDIGKGLRRVVDDLSSYYLLGYYSSGKLDGRFHPITVRVKRPGVQVRARRGYMAATPAAVTASARSAAPAPTVAAETAAVQTALASLAQFQRESPLRVHVATGWRARAEGGAVAAFWVVGEFSASASAAATPLSAGGDVDVTVISASGATVGRATGRGGTRSVMVPVRVDEATSAGSYTVRVRADGFGVGTVQVQLLRRRTRAAHLHAAWSVHGQQGRAGGGPALSTERTHPRRSAGAD